MLFCFRAGALSIQAAIGHQCAAIADVVIARAVRRWRSAITDVGIDDAVITDLVITDLLGRWRPAIADMVNYTGRRWTSIRTT
jgi:hypothetical protein